MTTKIYRALVIRRVSLTSAVRISSVSLSRNCNSNIVNFLKMSSQLSHFLVILISPVSQKFSLISPLSHANFV